MKRLLALAAAVLALALAPPAFASHPAGLFSRTDQVVPMDDGAGIATTLYVPVEHDVRRFPAVMVFHGLGGTRQSVDAVAAEFARNGYVVLSFDFRGHGGSTGLFTGLGPREIADVSNLRRWLAQKEEVTDRIGAWGISLGGGAVLRAAGEGVGFAAIEVVETWTDLYEALVPQGLPKTGAIFQFLGAVPANRQATELLALRDAVARRDVATLRTFAQARSSRHLMDRPYPPTLFFQGRQDFAFGLEQGLAAYARLNTPKALYIGPFGHAPSTFPGPDRVLFFQRALEWFNRHLKGAATPQRQPVELVSESGTASRQSAAVPATRTLRFRLPGRATIGASGRVVRRVRLTGAQETFGAPVVRVGAASTSGWSHLVAVLVARTPDGREIVVSEGGAPTRLTRRARNVTIRLISQVKLIPARSRLELTLAGTSTAQNPQNLLYLVPVPLSARVTIGNAELRLPVLRTPVSR